MFYGYLADVVVTLHLGYIIFCILATLLVVVGVFLRWQWIRNPIFRWAHALMIILVAFEAAIGYECPLTTWEYDLRRLQEKSDYARVVASTIASGNPVAGTPIATSASLYPGQINGPRPYDFIGEFCHDTLFVDWEIWVLITCYFTFATIVVVCFIVAPPRWRKKEKVMPQLVDR